MSEVSHELLSGINCGYSSPKLTACRNLFSYRDSVIELADFIVSCPGSL